MADVTALKAAVTEWASRVTSEAVARVVDDLREAAPFAEEGGGETRREIHAVDTSAGPVLGATVISPTHQGERVESQPAQRIFGNPVLVFTVGGETIITRYVDWPGPNPWFHPTVEESWPRRLREAADLFTLT